MAYDVEMAHVAFATQIITLAMSIASGFGTLSSTLVSLASMHDFRPSFACDNMTIPIQFNSFTDIISSSIVVIPPRKS
jgi:hypothetical protein